MLNSTATGNLQAKVAYKAHILTVSLVSEPAKNKPCGKNQSAMKTPGQETPVLAHSGMRNREESQKQWKNTTILKTHLSNMTGLFVDDENATRTWNWSKHWAGDQ